MKPEQLASMKKKKKEERKKENITINNTQTETDAKD